MGCAPWGADEKKAERGSFLPAPQHVTIQRDAAVGRLAPFPLAEYEEPSHGVVGPFHLE